MALTREQKEQRVAEASEALTKAMSYVLVTYDALTVPDVEELRGKMHEAGVSMRVLPKRLLRLVLQQVKLDFDPTQHEGQMAVAWSDDLVAPAKVLAEFVKGHEHMQMVAGAMEGVFLSQAEVQALALLPSRKELLAKVVGSLAAPLTKVVRVLSGVQAKMVFVLVAIRDQKEKSNQ